MQLFLLFRITILILHTPFMSLIKHVCRLLGHDVCRSLLLWIHNVSDIWNMSINMVKHFNVYLWICIVNFVVVFAFRAPPTESLEVLSRTHEDSEGDSWLSGMILLFFWLCEDVFAFSSARPGKHCLCPEV